ncbi:MAG: ATP-binding cassette domain-containing protein [Puniceicoccales bacterium]|nr:ATP-binding cassette domain-containing protein [Puniceicoccales bacterium]
MTAPLFQNLTVQFPTGWTGVAGANGAGKTTLLKIATGLLAPSAGNVVRRGDALYVAQRTDTPPENWAEFFWSPDSAALKSRLRMGEDWDTPERWQTLSHGERKRAQIAVAIWLQPSLLALDEPTNHIDADARALLLPVLRDFSGTGLLVSHDRELLDTLCRQCLLIDPPSAVLRPGGITDALAQQDSEERSAQHESDVLRRASSRLRSEAQERRTLGEQKAAAMRGSHQRKNPKHDPDGREKRNLAKLTNKDAWAGKQAGQLYKRAGKLEATKSALSVKKRYETGIWVEGASFLPRDFLLRLPAGELPLGDSGRVLRFPELALRGNDRIALTGANGLGKSTLLTHLLSRLELAPEHLVRVPQEISAEESRALLDDIRKLPETERGRVMTAVSRLGSRPGRLLESELPSPGEVRKILLALGIVRGPHLIVMDEPTNHLDLPGILCLEDALVECPCAMLLVSHDRPFLEKITRSEWHLFAENDGSSRLKII